MILGKNGKFKGRGYVCFIDVLGFSNDILKNWHNSEYNPLEKILSIKDEMPIFDDSSEESESDSHRKYVCRVNTVSDSVTICFGYDEKIMVGDMVLGLEAVISNLSYVWSTFISRGYTIRGAIDYGDIYWDTNELIGPAFINAYRLESEVAKNSFRKDVDGYIIIDPSLLHDTDEQRVQLIEDLQAMKNKVNSGIVKEKYNPLISMLSEENRKTLEKQEFGNY